MRIIAWYPSLSHKLLPKFIITNKETNGKSPHNNIVVNVKYVFIIATNYIYNLQNQFHSVNEFQQKGLEEGAG